ncbi:TIM-barrel domain-containing protein [Oceanispirochaeta sp.]|uniref:TIM-barrel domain-containing protein n=1 Tax=Oceanispirochaeta sp. TaxID=2035350 RepID=UPI002627963C|nr:TIM-barrel domain-containing protein [Oceanispirochaeta sp.]MDA3958363.1 glycoside hydrolase [Oceanispirochaeta sp.]
MKHNRAIHSLNSVNQNKSSLVFSGVNGQIHITACRQGVYHIEYTFYHQIQGESQKRAASELYDPVRFETNELPVLSKETDELYTLTSGKDTLILRKADGVLTALHNDQIVHGGVIGSSDTVLPRYPLRILGGTGDETRVRFNFKMDDQDRFYGLGDKSGGLNKRGQRYQMFNRDALGYKASFSDPLYKSIPFLIKQSNEENCFTGLYFPATTMGDIDLGRESNFFYSIEMKGGPFAYVVFTGDSAWEILDGYTFLTGRPALPPLFTFGFLGSSMNYTDPDDADARVTGYFDNIEKHHIPCEGFYFSSGYVRADNGERYTFEWHKGKFPDPSKAIRAYRDRGYHIACNIKPGFLLTHPRYKELDEKGFFIQDQEGDSYSEYYWGNNASFIDLTNPGALDWWKKQLKEKLIDYGVSGIWNDNNELELEDQSLDAQKIRAIYPILMAKASWEVFKEIAPDKRPWVISRSGGAGLQQYARTWTGDNTSDYESMKYNKFMGMGLGLSGNPFYGHDIGGFFGDHPDTKQFIRWCQSAVFQPRFVIHSWNADGNPTEPWSFPEALETIRGLVEKHYEFMPYIYNTAIEASLTGIPMERPLVLQFPHDKGLDPDCDHYMFGDNILVLSAVKEGMETVTCTLPSGCRWFDPFTDQTFEGGQTLEFDYPYEDARYLVKNGSVVVTSPGCCKLNTGYFQSLRFNVRPEEGEIIESIYREDCGDSSWKEGSYSSYSVKIDTLQYRLEISRLTLAVDATDSDRKIEICLPEAYTFDDGSQVYEISGMPEQLILKFSKQ